MSAYESIPVKKLARRSYEVGRRRKYLIVLLIGLILSEVIFLGPMSSELGEPVPAYEPQGDGFDLARQYRYEEAVRSRQQTVSVMTLGGTFLLLVLSIPAAINGVILYFCLRKADGYTLCPVRLTDPQVYRVGNGSTIFTFTAHITAPDGTESVQTTSGVYTAELMTQLQWTETNHPDLYALFDRDGDRLLVLPPEDEIVA